MRPRTDAGRVVLEADVITLTQMPLSRGYGQRVRLTAIPLQPKAVPELRSSKSEVSDFFINGSNDLPQRIAVNNYAE